MLPSVILCIINVIKLTDWLQVTDYNFLKQESLANANVRARQQCMYEGRYRRNLSSVENPTVEANIMYAADAILPTPG